MALSVLWILFSIAGGIFQGHNPLGATTLTTTIDDDDAVINVVSTEGFAEPGFIVIGDERIAYSDVTGTAFQGTGAKPLIRGAGDTVAVAHGAGSIIRTVEASMINTSMQYNIEIISTSSGVAGVFQSVFASLRLIGNFLVAPMAFLGSDFAVITYIWGAVAMIVLLMLAIRLADLLPFT